MDASGEHVSLSVSGNIDYSKGAIAFFFKSILSFDDSSAHMLFGKRGGGNGVGDFYILKNTDNYLYFLIVDNSSVVKYVRYSTAMLSNIWGSFNHYHFVWDDTSPLANSLHLELYLNDFYLAPSANSGADSSWTTATPATTLAIGNDYDDTSRYAGGIIDELYITNNPHTPQNWTANYKPTWKRILDY